MKEKDAILRKLYRGEICPDAQFLQTEEFIEKRTKKAELYKEIQGELNSQVLEKLRQYIELETELSSMDSENQFMIGFKLATNLIHEGLNISDI